MSRFNLGIGGRTMVVTHLSGKTPHQGHSMPRPSRLAIGISTHHNGIVCHNCPASPY